MPGIFGVRAGFGSSVGRRTDSKGFSRASREVWSSTRPSFSMSEILPVMRRTASANCVAIASFSESGGRKIVYQFLQVFPIWGRCIWSVRRSPKCKAALKALDDLF